MRTRRVVAAVAIVGVMSAGCAGDDGALDLTDDGTAAPSETEPPVEVTEDPDPPPPDEDEEQLYPPLPPLEPDPDSDVEVGLQETILDLHADVYHLTQTALATGEFDADELATVLGGDLLDTALDAFEERRRGGITERSPDSEVRYVRVVSGGSGPVVVWECRVVGPETIDVDADGQPISVPRDEPVPVLFEVTYEVLEVSEGVLGYRATFNERLPDTGDCGE